MKLIQTIQNFVCSNIIEDKKHVQESLDKIYNINMKITTENVNLIEDRDELKQKTRELEKEIKTLKQTISSLQSQIEEWMLKAKTSLTELEKYWNSKITPTTSIWYRARDGKNMNVMRFWHEHNDKTPTVSGTTNDIKANNALKYVARNVTYTSDMITSGRTEQWQWTNETVDTKKGDCEDGAILMANIMIKSGIPYWRIRLNAGDVQGGGHAYITYLRERDNKWYILDWCYWYNESVDFKRDWAEAKKYFGIWFSWNNKYAFEKDLLDR